MVKITRSQYLKGECTHQDYYMQFATPQIVARVKRTCDLDVLRKSTDGHFNDVYRLQHWDNVIGVFPADVAAMMREAGDYPTLAGSVSLAKAVARSLISE